MHRHINYMYVTLLFLYSGTLLYNILKTLLLQKECKYSRHRGGKTSKKYTMMNFVHDPPFLIHISIPFFLYFHIL